MNESISNLKEAESPESESINDTLKNFKYTLQEYARRQPYLMLGLAASAGYILAAGVPPRVISYLVRTGIKSGLSAAIGKSLEGVVREFHGC